jgi:TolB-like protein/Flp pilus assembly protein TadD
LSTAAGGEAPSPEHSRGAVFLSYASEDAVAADKICTALRAAGIEVWFDRSELRGGDAWDAAIRRQIKSCALFVPIISGNAHARAEGYFRLEWKLAVDRSHLIAPDKPFLVPVAIDGTPQSDERIPDRFRELQWTRLPGGETPPAFVERVNRLLAPSAAEALPATPAARSEQAADASPRSGRGLWVTLIWATTLVIVVPVIGHYVYQAVALRRNATATAGSLAPAPGGQAIPEKSIAVLPFIDMSERHDQEYFSDGLAEELLDLLAQVPDLRVPARTSSFYFKGKTDDVAAIAQKLRVAHLLEGSVRRSGDKIRVTAQLIRADNGYHLWSKTYDRDAKDVFQVQDEIANAVVTALKAQLLSSQPLTSRHRTSNPQAFNEYLLGNQLRERDTVDSNREALESYQRAAALDPSYAAAYSGIADAEWRVADQLTGEPAGYQRALAAAERAIALAPDSPEGYWARGNLRGTYFHDWSGAEADFRKALELDPNDAKSMREYGELLAARGDLAGGIEHLHKAVTLDPLAGRTRRQLAQLLLDAGKTDEAREAAQQLESVLPNSWASTSTLGLVALAEGNFREALTQFQRDPGPWNLIGTAMAQHSLGNAAASQAALDQLLQDPRYPMSLAYQIAEAYAWRGERAKALEWLERAYQQHDGGLIYTRHDRFLAGLRNEAGYRALLQKLNLPR